MARLHAESDDELPDLSIVLASYAKVKSPNVVPKTPIQHRQEPELEMESRPRLKGELVRPNRPVITSPSSPQLESTNENVSAIRRDRIRRQRPLGPAPINSFLLAAPTATLKASNVSMTSPPTGRTLVIPRERTELFAKEGVEDAHRVLGSTNSFHCPDELPFEMLDPTPEEVIDGYVHRPLPTTRRRAKSRGADPQVAMRKTTSTDSQAPSICSAANIVDIVLLSQTEGSASSAAPVGLKSLDSTNGSENEDMLRLEPSAMLKLYTRLDTKHTTHADNTSSSPPKPSRRSPAKRTEDIGFSTPPATPSKSKLQSPRKQCRIPLSPHRPSIDSFWSQEMTNEWNDVYSPRKVPESRRARNLHSIISEEDLSRSTSPQRSPVRGSVRKDRKASEAKRVFSNDKDRIARKFLSELDDVIGNGRVASLTAGTGGIHLVWSKKLNSTAGRANWRQEIVRSNVNGDPSAPKYRHHASIELAEKVIDNEGRYKPDGISCHH